jgi:hypothetical protein
MVIGQYLLPQVSLPSHLTHQWQWFINAASGWAPTELTWWWWMTCGLPSCRKLRIVDFLKAPPVQLKSSNSFVTWDILLTDLLLFCCSPLISQLSVQRSTYERWKARLKVLCTKVFDRNTWLSSFQFSVVPEVSSFDFKFILFED